jgi:ATP-dependent DNA helicase DinG
MSSIVALDIETTGLEPERDAIIEVGAVHFNGSHVEKEWSTLVNPGRPIPPDITRLTGIHNEMVVSAPYLQDVYADFLDFVGNVPILGHNIGFDLSFLRRRGGLMQNPIIDTFEMAAVLLPGIERYSLGTLATVLNIPDPASHRGQGAHGAMYDARLTYAVYMQLFERAQTLPLEVLTEIVRLSEGQEWGGRWPFQQALFLVTQHSLTRKTRGKKAVRSLYLPHGEAEHPAPRPALQPRAEPLPLNVDEVAALLEHGGAFSHHFPEFEYRPQQVEMLRAVARALSEGYHLLVEAGTGVGKSIAYLIPAALYALQNQTRVVISTNTINLQEQLIRKDIPSICTTLGLDLQAAVLKGRANYLCPRRLEILCRRGVENAEEMRVVAKVLVWLQTTQSGDRSELNLNRPGERLAWERLSAEDEGCTIEACIKRTGGTCPFYRSRQDAQSAHLLIVNHALLLSDVTTGSRVLPDYEHLIVDEGHHLEDATTNALSLQITKYNLERMLRELGGPKSGLLGRLLSVAHKILQPDQIAGLDHLVEQATNLAFRLDNQLNQFFVMVGQFLFEQRQERQIGPYPQQERVIPATRTLPVWMDVEVSWENADRSFKPLLEAGGQLIQAAAQMSESELEEMEDIFSSLSDLYRRLGEAHSHINALVFNPSPGQIYWIEGQPDGKRLSLHSAPLHIGPLMERHLWYEKTSLVVTSATLSTAGEFDYIKERLNAYDVDELSLGSPFDYETSALLYLVNDIPEPGDRHGHQRALESGLINLCQATAGRTLVLFTAYSQLRETAQAITPLLARAGIAVFEQGQGASRHALLETFRDTEQAVLLGTRAFWEGVDVPGEALSVLVIARLPFDVPSDPIVAARAETFDDSFYQYSLPEAILSFRQGFGRLIRTQSDRGVVAVFDRRVLTKRYGHLFIDSLPPCTTRVGPLADLPRNAAQWLNL